jgi:hypothetical protein
MALTLAMSSRLLFLSFLNWEREAEFPEQPRASSSVFAVVRDDDVHAPHLVDLVIVDLREHDVLLQAHGVVAAAIERLGVQAAEVADARQRDRDQTVEELVHAVTCAA